MPLYHTVRTNGTTPILAFISSLDPKLRQKLSSQFLLLLQNPALGEPHVKHFTISKYANLYELRTRSNLMVRIIFTHLPDGGVLLLEPFIKRHKRNTMQALNASLVILRQYESGECRIKPFELP